MFTKGSKVTLTDKATNLEITGTLHLEETTFHMANGSSLPLPNRPATTDGSYGLHTITLPNGRKYKDFGILIPA